MRTEGKKQTKKTKRTILLSLVLILALLVGLTCLFLPDYLEDLELAREEEKMAQEIAEFIAKADEKANEEDFDAALEVMRKALIDYPTDKELQEKQQEYIQRKEAKIKADTLAEAASLAAEGEYDSAMDVLMEALEKGGKDEDYHIAYETYLQAGIAVRKATGLSTAEDFMEEGKYPEAIEALERTMEDIGEDATLKAKITECEAKYAEAITREALGYLDSQDYEAAANAVSAGLELFPENATLLECGNTVVRRTPKNLIDACPPYKTSGYYTEKSYTIDGSAYSGGFQMDDDSGGIAYFDLNREYSLFRFDVGHRDGKAMQTGYYFVYLDGDMYELFVFQPDAGITTIEIPVEGVTTMIIKAGAWSECYVLLNLMLMPSETGPGEGEAPVKGGHLLFTCPPVETKGYTEKTTFFLREGAYNNGFSLNDNYGGMARYVPDGKYQVLSFDAGHIDGKNNETGYYDFYLDGELVQTLVLDPAAEVQHYEIPLNGAKELIIIGGAWCHCYALVNVRVDV
ncbi:MAG: hypothetical protein IKT58_00895 [Oscillospiraceae bacterium]|nr:hypothetical protein [Oscillospiraceae bacterium]